MAKRRRTKQQIEQENYVLRQEVERLRRVIADMKDHQIELTGALATLAGVK